MESINFQPPQTNVQPPAYGGDWRSQILPESRQRIINKITETLKRHSPFGQEGLQALKLIATRFEEKIYDVATSQDDYLRKISLKMLKMESNNFQPSQTSVLPPAYGGDWRSQLLRESRQRVVNKITETLKRNLPFSGQEGLQELKLIATRFEEKIFDVATSQVDYLRKISLKMLTMEAKSQNTFNTLHHPGYVADCL